MSQSAEAPRLFLVTPPRVDDERFPGQLAEVLGGAEIAAVLIGSTADRAGTDLAAELVSIVQAAGAAALIPDDTRLAGRLKADGVHVGTGLGDLRAAVESFSGKRIVGAANIHTRHTAMAAGEIGADYVFFGRPHADTHDQPHPKAIDLAGWWSELMEIPAVIMAGRSLDSINAAVATGAAFVGLHDAVWSHTGGPAEAVRIAAQRLAGPGRRAA